MRVWIYGYLHTLFCGISAVSPVQIKPVGIGVQLYNFPFWAAKSIIFFKSIE
jgi:hypothetical protein